MHISRRVWGVLAVLGFCGCGDEGVPPSPTGPTSSPAVKSSTAPTSPGTGSAEQASPAPKKADTGSAPAPKEKAGAVEPPPPLEAPKTGAADEPAKAKLSDKQLAAIKQLPESEQAAAIAQAACPVSGGALGSMGKPIKVSAEGRSFYLCCDGCEDKVKSDPKGVVAKLDKK